MGQAARINLRLESSDKAEIDRRAKDAGLGTSEYLRRLGLGRMEPDSSSSKGGAGAAGVDWGEFDKAVLRLARQVPVARALREARAELGVE